MSTVPAMAKATTSGGDMRKLALMLWWTRASKLRLPESTEAATMSSARRRPRCRVERAGVADAGGAAVADGLETEFVEFLLEAGFFEVIGDHAAAGAEAGFHAGLTVRPRALAFWASRPAASMTLGLLVLVQLVMAAMSTEPWRDGVLDPALAVDGDFPSGRLGFGHRW
jgi:hypothetical protein